MYYQVEQVLSKYEPETENFYKGRGILICETKQGLFALKVYHGSAQKAEFLYWLGRTLREQGICCDDMIKNRENELISEGVDGERYTMHHWIKGKECDVKNRMDIMMAVSYIAGFHAGLSCGIPEPVQGGPDYMCQRHMSLYEEYGRHNRELKKIRKYIAGRHNKSDFERLFLVCFPEYFRQAERVLGYLKRENEKTDQYTVGICHGDLNQHNIIFSSEKPALIHLEHAYVGIQIADLGNFMRKILEKYDWEERLGFEMLREYCRVYPLHRADLQGLYYRLSYPEKFWKLANHYYNSSKVWDPGRNYEKLQREIRQNISRKRFLEQFRIKILSQIS